MYSHSLEEYCNTLVNVLEMGLKSLTRVSYNYMDQGNREVNNGRVAEAEMFKMGVRPDPPGTTGICPQTKVQPEPPNDGILGT
jgi:hypothetical protein